jgi:uncharacterized protein YceK
MKKFNFGMVLALTIAITGCSSLKENKTASSPGHGGQRNENVQSESTNQEAVVRAANLTAGWPTSSMTAAREMIDKYGEPHETTSDSLIWRNVAPFREVIVHRNVYSHRFPLLHQTALEHVVDYKATEDRIQEVLKYNGSIIINRTKGQMSALAENEPMNVLALNLADKVMQGKLTAEQARVTFGKETMDFLNGKKTANTQVLNFGNQFNTADQGESVTNKIRWIGDPEGTREAQEEKK